MKKRILWGACSMMALLLVGCGSSASVGQETRQNTPQPTATVTAEQKSENYHVEGSTVYVDKNCYLPDVKAENATEMIIADKVQLKDYEAAGTKDEDSSFSQPQYNSWFAGSPEVKNVSLEKADVTIGKKNKAYVDDGLLLYKGKTKGVYACVPAKEGKVSIPQGVKDIYDCAFYGCNQITSVTLPESVRWIGEAAFGENKKLKKIEVASNNPFLKSVDGVLYTKDGRVLLAYPAGKTDKTYKVGTKVKYIARGAFAGAENLEKIVLPKGLFSIEDYAFKGCTSLKTFGGASKVYRVKTNAYAYCDALDESQQLKTEESGEDTLVSNSRWEEDYLKGVLSYLYSDYSWKFSKDRYGNTSTENIIEALKENGKVPAGLEKKIDSISYQYAKEVLYSKALKVMEKKDLQKFGKQVDAFLETYGD